MCLFHLSNSEWELHYQLNFICLSCCAWKWLKLGFTFFLFVRSFVCFYRPTHYGEFSIIQSIKIRLNFNVIQYVAIVVTNWWIEIRWQFKEFVLATSYQTNQASRLQCHCNEWFAFVLDLPQIFVSTRTGTNFYFRILVKENHYITISITRLFQCGSCECVL